MQATDTNSVEPFYWDNFRDTTMGSYLFHHEHTFVRRSLDAAIQPGTLLDIGCGSGRMTLPLHDVGINVVGLDMDPVALAAFQRRSKAIPLVRGDAVHLPFTDGSFDCVVAIQFFEYVDHQQFLHELNRVLRNGGLLIIEALNRHSYKWPLKKLLSRGVTLPSASLSCREMLPEITAHGFDVQAISGYNWVPFMRESNSRLVGIAALIEQMLRLDRYYSISPKILVAARKRSSC